MYAERAPLITLHGFGRIFRAGPCETKDQF